MAESELGAGSPDMRGQVALVTGGGRGLGRAYAAALAAAGAAVAVAARSADELDETVRLVRERGGAASAFPLDLADPSAAERCVAGVEARLGPVDLLVNNAAVMFTPAADWEVEPERWWRTFEVNVRGAYLCARAVLPGMIRRRRGRIVNISSNAAFGTRPGLSAYAASKAAVTHWTRTLAGDVEPHGVAVFAYSPGLVRTAMTESVYPHLFEQGQGTPVSRAVETFMVLASGRADALTGRHFRVDDDLPALIARADQIRRDDLYVADRRV